MWGRFENPFVYDASLDPRPLLSLNIRRRYSALSAIWKTSSRLKTCCSWNSPQSPRTKWSKLSKLSLCCLLRWNENGDHPLILEYLLATARTKNIFWKSGTANSNFYPNRSFCDTSMKLGTNKVQTSHYQSNWWATWISGPDVISFIDVVFQQGSHRLSDFKHSKTTQSRSFCDISMRLSPNRLQSFRYKPSQCTTWISSFNTFPMTSFSNMASKVYLTECTLSLRRRVNFVIETWKLTQINMRPLAMNSIELLLFLFFRLLAYFWITSFFKMTAKVIHTVLGCRLD